MPTLPPSVRVPGLGLRAAMREPSTVPAARHASSAITVAIVNSPQFRSTQK